MSLPDVWIPPIVIGALWIILAAFFIIRRARRHLIRRSGGLRRIKTAVITLAAARERALTRPRCHGSIYTMSSGESETRKRIVETAWRLLVDQRGKAARMSDIAAAAGVSRQAVYLHFGSRSELLIAATRHGDAVLGLEGGWSRTARRRAAWRPWRRSSPSGVSTFRRFTAWPGAPGSARDR